MKTTLSIMGTLIALAGASFAQVNIYSDANDGFLEARDSLPPTNPWPAVHGDTFGGWSGNIGEWYGEGLTTVVIPFQLPDMGVIDNPFDTAAFRINFYEMGDATVTPLDLYAVRVDASPLISTNDWYTGNDPDATATMIQPDFLSPSSAIGLVGTDAAGSSNLVAYLNTAYNGGTGIGQYIFLRLSYTANGLASGWDAYKITMREAALDTDWPVIIVTTTELDSDRDGLPDVWELSNSLDPFDDGTVDPDNGAAGDPDEDTLVNSDEFALDTDPQVGDSDNDGLTDGDEVHVHDTEPLMYDSDGDRLGDGDEVNIHGTQPTYPHSDTDGEPDGVEVAQGTDPLDAASSSAALGLIIIDGVLDSAYYGDALATQTVNTVWGDNADELDAAYAVVKDGKLHLMLTGNMADNWNKHEIFIDSTDAVTTNVLTTLGNDGTGFMDGLTFDEGFEPDYHLNVRRGSGNFFNFDMAELGTTNVSYHENIFNGSMEGFTRTGVGPANAEPVGVAYDNSNTNGLVYGDDAADSAAVLAVRTGLEISILLSDLGNPAIVRVGVFINGGSHDWVSNQSLGGLAPPQGALGRDGLDGGDELTNLGAIDFSAIPGDQYFTVPISLPSPEISSVRLVAAATALEFGVSGLAVRGGYKLQDTDDLTGGGFAEVPGSAFTATNTSMFITVPVDTASDPTLFFKVIAE